MTTLSSRLRAGSLAARADQGARWHTLHRDHPGLEIRLHSAVGPNAVHARRLRVEAAHRNLAADGAGTSHWSSKLEVTRARGPSGGPERGRMIPRTSEPNGDRRPRPRGRRPRANRPSRTVARHETR